MMAARQNMMASMMAGQEKLDDLIAKMSAATGQAEIDLMAATITEIGAQSLPDPLLEHRRRIRGAMPGRQGAGAVGLGRFVQLFEDVEDDQCRVVALREGKCAFQRAITASTQVGREKEFARSAGVVSGWVHGVICLATQCTPARQSRHVIELPSASRGSRTLEESR